MGHCHATGTHGQGMNTKCSLLIIERGEVRSSRPDHNNQSIENICDILSVQTSPLPALQQSGHLAGPGKNALRGKNS